MALGRETDEDLQDVLVASFVPAVCNFMKRMYDLRKEANKVH